MTNHIQDQYTGSVAKDYESKRQTESKWTSEQDVVRGLLSQISSEFANGATILDVPVGTGRFIPFYSELGFELTGADISEDMLTEAGGTAAAAEYSVELVRENIESLSFDDEAFGTVLCIRILNWVDWSSLKRICAELARVSKGELVIGVRVTEIKPGGSIRSLAQLLPFSAVRAYRQVKLKLKPGRLKIHQESKVARFFDELDLIVKSRVLVERSARFSTYYIYHLEKR